MAPLASSMGLFMYDICHLWLAGDVLVEVEVDHSNGETFFTLFEKECGFASPSREREEREEEERHRPMT